MLPLPPPADEAASYAPSSLPGRPWLQSLGRRASRASGFTASTTIPVVVYPRDWFEEFNLLTTDGYLEHMFTSYAEDTALSFTYYDSAAADDFLEDLSAGFEPGTVVLFKEDVSIATVTKYRWVSR
jgi:hypothetical protein